MKLKPVIPRLEKNSYVDKNGCWVWTGAKNLQGYGKISVKGKLQQTHRVSYEIFIGTIPDGLCIDHLCRNRACLNPNHLDVVTKAENIRRGLKGMMVKFCKKGHEYNENTTYVDPKYGTRKCKICREERNKSDDRKLKAREYMRSRRMKEKLERI